MTDEPVRLRVTEALAKDMGHGFARVGPEDLARLGLGVGDTVEVEGKRITMCRVMLAYEDVRGQSRVQLDGISRDNAHVGLDDYVMLRRRRCAHAEQITLTPINVRPSGRDIRYVASLLDGLPLVEGDRVRVALFGSRTALFKVKKTSPAEPVIVQASTLLNIGAPEEEQETRALSYEDIGGLKPQLPRIRAMVELPLRLSEGFHRLGIEAPEGGPPHGPPGAGQTPLARPIAPETDAPVLSIPGPEVRPQLSGESEAHLRKIFEEASKKSPSIIFLDEIDSIAPSRERVVGDVEKRVVAQLLGLMDGLKRRESVIVIAATNIPNALDPALRRPGRFDREIAIPIPDVNGRLQILEIHSRGMPLGPGVDLPKLAEITHGFVGADLEALCREAAMRCLRRFLPDLDFTQRSVPLELLSRLVVRPDDFVGALGDVEPSAIREVFVEVPSVRWDDVGGLEQIKRRLIEAVEWPLKHADLFEKAGVRAPKGILLTGPPGCGKTLLAKAIATESGVNFISVKGAELLSKYVGESERAVRDVFHKARQAAPCIAFFDEIDALLPERSSGGGESHVGERVISQFLTEMDGIEELHGVLVLGASNRPDIIDPAVLRPGRFDAMVEIPKPSLEDRLRIYSVHLRGKPLAPGVDAEELVRLLAAGSDGMSGAEIALVCERAALAAVRRVIEEQEGEIAIRREELEGSLAEVAARAKPSKRGKELGPAALH